MTKNIKLGIIIDGEVYEPVENENTGCINCDFCDGFRCIIPHGENLCWAFNHTYKFEDCIFKKVNTDGEH